MPPVAVVVPVDDAGDPRLADYVGLTDPDLRRRVEGDGGFFVVEGTFAVERLLVSAFRPRSFLLTAKAAARLGPDALATGAPVYVAEPTVMRQVVGFDIHRGVVASVTRPTLPSVGEVVAGAATMLVIEGVNDHENLGGLFRNAAAFGVDAVVLDPTCADPFYRRAVRVSMGHVLGVPFARASAWPGALDDLRADGTAVVALTGNGSVAVDAYRRPTGAVALLVGAEGPGLSGAALAAADVTLRIPMAPGVDSLNVATAAAIALHHLADPARRH